VRSCQPSHATSHDEALDGLEELCDAFGAALVNSFMASLLPFLKVVADARNQLMSRCRACPAVQVCITLLRLCPFPYGPDDPRTLRCERGATVLHRVSCLLLLIGPKHSYLISVCPEWARRVALVLEGTLRNRRR
jgi:hypothetical protein